MTRLYCDHAATTPLLPPVWAAMEPWLRSEFGNPSSTHAEGRRAKEAIDLSRERVSAGLGTLFAEVQFTSSGTEAANAAILGATMAHQGNRRKVLLGAAEHHCVLHCMEPLARMGFMVELVPVDARAAVRLDALESMLDDDVLLVSIMAANNETGVINDWRAAGRLAQAHGALFHTDMVQVFASLLDDEAFFLDQEPVDFASFSAHKIGGPKAVGALYSRAGTDVVPLIVGGGQEREMRAGTENVAGIVGLGEAVLHAQEGTARAARDAFRAALGDAVLWTLSDSDPCLPGHAHFRVPGQNAETMLIALDRAGISASSGAACSSGSLEPSHVLLATGLSEKESMEGLRFTFGRGNDADFGREAAARVAACLPGWAKRRS